MASVLVTGCSSGFGHLIAKTLAVHGHTVYATLREMHGRNAAAAQALRDLGLRLIELDVGSDDSVQRLVDMPSGHRPLRLVVGPIFTEGVAEYNESYLRVRANLERSLRRPDQAITWTPDAREQTS